MSSAPTPAPASSGMQDNVASMLCYIPLCLVGLIMAIVFLVMEPYNKNKVVRFHAFQSIFLHIAFIVLDIACWILMVVLAFVSHILAGLFYVLLLVVGLGLFVLMLFLCFQAYSNKQVKLPFIGELAAKQAGS